MIRRVTDVPVVGRPLRPRVQVPRQGSAIRFCGTGRSTAALQARHG